MYSSLALVHKGMYQEAVILLLHLVAAPGLLLVLLNLQGDV